ncbi:MAG TPA: sigma-54 dependent transcriptional regulator [Longimicrobiales bacterium]|nr:sigma-54 dependent transcriptional regulator [Longimicrobiales bacterium]
MSRTGRILVVDDDRAFRLSTAELLRQDGHDVELAADGQAAVDVLRATHVDLILLDLRMPGTDGLGVVEALRRWGQTVPILMISGFGTVESAVEAIHLGADDFLTKPVEPERLSERVSQLLERRPAPGRTELVAPDLIGNSAEMERVREAIATVAPTTTTVLVTGETGTGKEVVARAIHAGSPHSSGPFVAVNCAAIAETLLESELFGHVRGAFTGADRDRKGLFEAAHGGTLLLDEIGDVSPGLQTRLLRILQERSVRRVGGVTAVPVNVRVIATTARDLRADVAEGRFREDLFYRLNVFPIAVPPLRERPSDVPALAAEGARRITGSVRNDRFTTLAMRLLCAYRWPGNVRELMSAVESALIRAGGGRVDAAHLPEDIRTWRAEGGGGLRYSAPPGDEEKEAILDALRRAGGNRARASEILGMGRTTLWRKLTAYDIDADAAGSH